MQRKRRGRKEEGREDCGHDGNLSIYPILHEKEIGGPSHTLYVPIYPILSIYLSYLSIYLSTAPH